MSISPQLFLFEISLFRVDFDGTMEACACGAGGKSSLVDLNVSGGQEIDGVVFLLMLNCFVSGGTVLDTLNIPFILFFARAFATALASAIVLGEDGMTLMGSKAFAVVEDEVLAGLVGIVLLRDCGVSSNPAPITLMGGCVGLFVLEDK